MATRLSSRDYEQLSAFLDGQLQGTARQRLEARLEKETALREELEELRRTRVVLRSLPRLRAPRNFTLTPQMVGRPTRPVSRLYPVMGFASALATLLFALVLVGDLLGFLPGTAPSSAPMIAQEAPPQAQVPPTESVQDQTLMQKSAASETEATPLPEAASGLAIESPLAPTQVTTDIAGLMAAPPQGTATPETQAAEPVTLLGEAPTPGGVGGGVYSDTIPAPGFPGGTPPTGEAPVGKRLGNETYTPTLTYTPTPMPTETPMGAQTPTLTFTPTPMPTETPVPSETPLPSLEIFSQPAELPSPTPTQEVLAMGEGNVATQEAAPVLEPAPATQAPSTSEEGRNFLPEEPATSPFPLLFAIQVGLLGVAVTTGLIALFLRLRRR